MQNVFGDFDSLFESLKWPQYLSYEGLEQHEVMKFTTKISSIGRVFRNMRVDRKNHKFLFQYPHKNKLHLTRMFYKFNGLGENGILFNLVFHGHRPVLDKISDIYFPDFKEKSKIGDY